MSKKIRIDVRHSGVDDQRSEAKHVGGTGGSKSSSELSMDAVGQDANQKHSHLGESGGKATSKSVDAEAASGSSARETYHSDGGAGASSESSDGPSAHKIKVKHQVKVK